jgi:hypothetical protein
MVDWEKTEQKSGYSRKIFIEKTLMKNQVVGFYPHSH